MPIFKKHFELRTQQNESLSKLVDALKENNKHLRELLTQSRLNANKQEELIQATVKNTNILHNDIHALMDTEKTFIEKMESTLKMQTTIESDRLELARKTYEETQPTEDDARY